MLFCRRREKQRFRNEIGKNYSAGKMRSAALMAETGRTLSAAEWRENMRLVIQRVTSASVTIVPEDGEASAAEPAERSIGQGLVVLLGVGQGDTEQIADIYADKLRKLRIFADENGKTNRSLTDVGGELLIVSQFTLYADCSHGNRPGFANAGAPAEARRLYEYFVARCRECGVRTETGEFGADMKVALVNDGPFTIVLDEDIAARGKAAKR